MSCLRRPPLPPSPCWPTWGIPSASPGRRGSAGRGCAGHAPSLSILLFFYVKCTTFECCRKIKGPCGTTNRGGRGTLRSTRASPSKIPISIYVQFPQMLLFIRIKLFHIQNVKALFPARLLRDHCWGPRFDLHRTAPGPGEAVQGARDAVRDVHARYLFNLKIFQKHNGPLFPRDGHVDEHHTEEQARWIRHRKRLGGRSPGKLLQVHRVQADCGGIQVIVFESCNVFFENHLFNTSVSL